MSLRLGYKIWLEKENKVFGPGPARILKLVDEYGSLHRAAEEMGMSYSQAWNLVNTLEGRLGFALLESRTGGRDGGGSTLTVRGEELLNRFRNFEREADECLNKIAGRYFSEEWEAEIYSEKFDENV